jgi:hypothetical protein
MYFQREISRAVLGRLLGQHWIGLLWIGLACGSIRLSDQETKETDQPPGVAFQDATGLPPAWHGYWQGEVTTWSDGRERAKFQMELFVQATDDPAKLDWKIVYSGAASRSERPYQLHTIDMKRGQYVIDERNGIRLNASLLGDSLCFHFLTGGQRLWGSYRLDSNNQQIVFELLTGTESQESLTGGGDVPEVRSLPSNSRQVAILQRGDPPATLEPADGKGQTSAFVK